MRTLKLLLGSVVVYVAMAACSAGGGFNSKLAPDAGSEDGTASDVGTATDDAQSILDALTDPVPEAMAALPDIAVEQCNKTIPNSTTKYAEHLYPGKLKAVLAPIHVLAHIPSGASVFTTPPGGYEDFTNTPWIRDGAVAMVCSQGMDYATFVLP